MTATSLSTFLTRFLSVPGADRFASAGESMQFFAHVGQLILVALIA